MAETKDQTNIPKKPGTKGMGKFEYPASFQKFSPKRELQIQTASPQWAPEVQPNKGNNLKVLRKPLLVLFFIVLILTFFLKDRFKSVNGIMPELYREPVQTSASGDVIAFQKDGYDYKLTPLYDYDISGLVIHRLKYDVWYSLSRTDKVFTVDWCVLWGENVAKGVYKADSLSVSQDARFCFFSFSGDIGFSPDQLSNNHLVVSDPRLEKRINKIAPGDQVRIRGKLVNVEATAISDTTKYEHKAVTWNSSTSRKDTGAGACEIIYVQDIEILKKGHPILNFFFYFSELGLIVLLFWLALDIVLDLKLKGPPPRIHAAPAENSGGPRI